MLAATAPDKGFVDDLTQEFLIESAEGLDRMERCLTELEQRPTDRVLLDEIFRAVHTIKGTTGFLAFPRLEKLSHAGEHLLGLLRDGKLRATAPCIDGLLALLDGLRSILQQIETDGVEVPTDDDGPLLLRLQSLREEGTKECAAQPAPSFVDSSTAPSLLESTLRVEVSTLNQMLNLVGELVLTRNQISLHAQDELAIANARRLDAVTTDLRESMMRARTQPVEHLFGRLPRMVRDLGERLGRCVRLELSGQETRLDKALLDALRDPLIHVLRNAVDHGIEPPTDRVHRGKPLEATLRIAAYQEGGQVVIEVNDDGRGIDPEQVKERALSKGLITAEAATALSPAAAARLIFLPGFSTRDEVTSVSGRGVGMDIVRANVESVGGTIELESTPGTGTKLRMRVPLTLAIMPALVVRSGGCSFAFPRTEIRELMVVHRHEEHTLVQRVGDTLLLRMRGQMVPLVSLSETLALRRDDGRGYYVMILRNANREFGVIVDDLDEQQEIVVKPLSPALSANGLFSGASVLGNGELAFIVDVAALATVSHIEHAAHIATTTDSHRDGAQAESASIQSQMLVYESSRGERSAMPLAQVQRIESFAADRLERCNDHDLILHNATPIELDGIDPHAGENGGTLTVVLHKPDARSFGQRGLVVRRVLDIAEAKDGSTFGDGIALVRGLVVSLRNPALEAVLLKEAA